MGYYTRVLSKDEEIPSFEELAQLIRAEHPEYRLTIEDGDEEGWDILLLSGIDEVEVSVVDINNVVGQVGGIEKISRSVAGDGEAGIAGLFG